jgi:hypothetical protein
MAYSRLVGHALDKDNKKAGGPAAAIAAVQALEEALPEIHKQGSLGTVEFMVLDLRLMKALLKKDEGAVKSIFEEMKRQGWGQLYENLASTLGKTAEYMTPEEFEKMFRLFGEYQVPRRHYYGVVYAAFEARAVKHALTASKICLEKFPGDADMKREHELLVKLAEKK